MKSADVVVVGGGMAGLSVARELAPDAQVTLFEREPLLATHSSGRNAAIFRHLDLSTGVPELALRSARGWDSLFGSRKAWLQPNGALFAARGREPLAGLLSVAERYGIPHRMIGRDEFVSLSPDVEPGTASDAIQVPGDGIMDIHAMTTRLAELARASGASIRTGTEVTGIEAPRGHVEAVRLANGERVPCSIAVIGAGAWSCRLGETAGAPLPLVPMRRHLALLGTQEPLPPLAPVVWRIDDECYFRPEPGGALCSPCDEDQYEPCLPPTAPEALEMLADKMSRLAPRIAEGEVRRAWSGLRTFAPDRALVLGEDPRVRGLFWHSGMGGHGMTAGLASGALVADAVRGKREPLLDQLAPQRLLAKKPCA